MSASKGGERTEDYTKESKPKEEESRKPNKANFGRSE